MKVGIKLKKTLTTEKLRLGLPVTAVNVAAPAAPLTGMPWVYGNNLTAKSLSLILQEVLELSKAPGVKPSFGFPARGFNPIADVGEVLDNNSCAWLNAFENRSRKDVVTIPSEALFTPSEASKMTFGALRTIGLQRTSEAKDSLDDFLHMPVAMESVIRSNGGSGDSKVNADSFAVIDKGNIGQTDNNVKIELTFAGHKVSSCCRVTDCIPSVLRQLKNYFHSTLGSRQVYHTCFPVYLKGVTIIAGWATRRMRGFYLQPLFRPGDSRFDCFRSLLSSLNVQVGDKVGQSILTISICQVVKGISITSSLPPAYLTYMIKRGCKLLNCILKSCRLPIKRDEFYSYRSIHMSIIPYILQNMQERGRRFLCQLKQAVPSAQ